MSHRIRRSENASWRFAFGEHDVGGAETGDWVDIGLPHSFAVPADLGTTFYVGTGCYRHELAIDEAWIGRRICLEFGAVFQHAEVFVNGERAGGHTGGYTSFLIDITDLVRAGHNALFVRVDNEWDAVLPPRAGEHVFNGGIYRDVFLLVTDPVHVGWQALRVSTPHVDTAAATVRVDARIRNDSVQAARIGAVCSISLAGREVASASADIEVSAFGETWPRWEFEVLSPDLWHPDHPTLYDVSVSLVVDGVVTDVAADDFGIRWLEFTADRGFFLNGEHLWIDGVNVHQDHAGWGDGVTRAAIARDVALVKEAGMNFIRGSHYPHHEHFARECDRQGLLFWSEAPFWGTGGETIEGFWTASAYPVHEADEEMFEDNALRALEEMVRENINRPSVIAWSTGNEVYFSDRAVLDKAKALTSRMVDRLRELDPSRPAAVGGTQRGGLDVLGDLAGYNGDGATLYPDPGFPSIVSEYGSFVEDRPGESESRYIDGTEKRHPWRSGVALWCGFHHGSIFDGMSHMGFIDHHRLPLRSWFWYREKNTGVPMPEPASHEEPHALLLESDVATIGTDGLTDARLTLMVVDREGRRTDRLDEAVIEVVAGDGRLPTGRRWRVSADDGSLVDGLASVDLRSYLAGEIRVIATAEGLVAAGLTLTSVGDEAWDGRVLVFSASPPHRSGIPEPAETTNIARHRPVFASATAAHRMAAWVTEPNTAAPWVAPDETAGHWVIVDLEGPRQLRQIIIIAVGENPLRVSVSPVHRDAGYEVIGEGTPGADARLAWEFPARAARYIRIDFPAEPDEVHLVTASQ